MNLSCRVVEWTVDWRGVLSGPDAFFNEIAAVAAIEPVQTVRPSLQSVSEIYHGD